MSKAARSGRLLLVGEREGEAVGWVEGSRVGEGGGHGKFGGRGWRIHIALW